jgi:ribosomal protein L4
LVLLAFVLIFVLSVFMSAVKNIVPAKKRGRGRPRKDDPIRTVVRIALSASTADRFVEWMETKGISSQSEAGRMLIEQALAGTPKRGKAGKAKPG